MSTHAIGPGTCNLSVNVRQHVRAELGRTAFIQGISMGELVRRMICCARRIVGAVQNAIRVAKFDAVALYLLDRAQAPDSDGGENITPPESMAIKAAVRASFKRADNLARNLTLHAN